MYMYCIHFAVHLKLTQRCKSTMLQQKFKQIIQVDANQTTLQLRWESPWSWSPVMMVSALIKCRIFEQHDS